MLKTQEVGHRLPTTTHQTRRQAVKSGLALLAAALAGSSKAEDLATKLAQPFKFTPNISAITNADLKLAFDNYEKHINDSEEGPQKQVHREYIRWAKVVKASDSEPLNTAIKTLHYTMATVAAKAAEQTEPKDKHALYEIVGRAIATLHHIAKMQVAGAKLEITKHYRNELIEDIANNAAAELAYLQDPRPRDAIEELLAQTADTRLDLNKSLVLYFSLAKLDYTMYMDNELIRGLREFHYLNDNGEKQATELMKKADQYFSSVTKNGKDSKELMNLWLEARIPFFTRVRDSISDRLKDFRELEGLVAKQAQLSTDQLKRIDQLKGNLDLTPENLAKEHRRYQKMFNIVSDHPHRIATAINKL